MSEKEQIFWAALFGFFVLGFLSFGFMDSDGWLIDIVFILWVISGGLLYWRFEWFRTAIHWIAAFLLMLYALDKAKETLEKRNGK